MEIDTDIFATFTAFDKNGKPIGDRVSWETIFLHCTEQDHRESTHVKFLCRWPLCRPIRSGCTSCPAGWGSWWTMSRRGTIAHPFTSLKTVRSHTLKPAGISSWITCVLWKYTTEFWCRYGRRQQPFHFHQWRPQGQQEDQVPQRLPHQPRCLHKVLKITLPLKSAKFPAYMSRTTLTMRCCCAGRTGATCVATSRGRCWTTGSGPPGTPRDSGSTSWTTGTTSRDTPRTRCSGSSRCSAPAEDGRYRWSVHTCIYHLQLLCSTQAHMLQCTCSILLYGLAISLSILIRHTHGGY